MPLILRLVYQLLKFTLVIALIYSPLTFANINAQIGNSYDPTIEKMLPNYNMFYDKKERVVAITKGDGSAKAFIQILSPAAHLNTTKAYAQYVMDSYKGWGLKAQIARRGFSFQYIDNAPCVALISYFDGSSYLMFSACGFMSKEEITKAFTLAKKQLSLDDVIYRSSLQTVYY